MNQNYRVNILCDYYNLGEGVQATLVDGDLTLYGSESSKVIPMPDYSLDEALAFLYRKVVTKPVPSFGTLYAYMPSPSRIHDLDALLESRLSYINKLDSLPEKDLESLYSQPHVPYVVQKRNPVQREESTDIWYRYKLDRAKHIAAVQSLRKEVKSLKD